MFLKFINWLVVWLYRLAGWSVKGSFPIPPQYRKTIVVIAPHASWKDIMVGLCVRPQMGIKVGFLGKKELFEGLFGFFFRALGGTPVDRSKPNGLVEQVVEAFGKHEDFCIAIAPEGTRKNVSELKKGFYNIAVKAKVAIVLVGFDYPRKTVFFQEPFYPTGDWEADKIKIAEYYSTIQGVQHDWVANYLASNKKA